MNKRERAPASRTSGTGSSRGWQWALGAPAPRRRLAVPACEQRLPRTLPTMTSPNELHEPSTDGSGTGRSPALIGLGRQATCTNRGGVWA